MQKQSPLFRMWSWGKDEHSGLIRTILYNMALSIVQESIYADFVLGRKEAIGWKLEA